eukprot:COSAG02_NODE_43591_length_373_cov_0.934307_1_plen_51_part_10
MKFACIRISKRRQQRQVLAGHEGAESGLSPGLDSIHLETVEVIKQKHLMHF